MAKSKDPIRLAKDMFDEFLSKSDPQSSATSPPERNVQQKAAGRIGGLVGGPARKAALKPKVRSQIARDAARARWKKS